MFTDSWENESDTFFARQLLAIFGVKFANVNPRLFVPGPDGNPPVLPNLCETKSINKNSKNYKTLNFNNNNKKTLVMELGVFEEPTSKTMSPESSSVSFLAVFLGGAWDSVSSSEAWSSSSLFFPFPVPDIFSKTVSVDFTRGVR